MSLVDHSRPTRHPSVAVIVLNWNGLADTLACLASLTELDYSDYEVLIVDNGSTDGSVAAIREHFSEVAVIENGTNLGFTGGNNVGLRHALDREADYVLLLNNDTEVAPDFLSRLIEAMEARPTAGAAGPLIYYHDRPDVIWSAGGEVDWRRGQTRMLGLDQRDVGQFGQQPREVDFVSGCAMLVRRSALEQVGLLDERFFVYYEEVEWCVRMRRAGFQILCVPQAHVWHRIAPQRQADSPTVHYYMTRNRLLLLKVIRAGWGVWLNTLLGDYLRTLVSWSVRPRWRHRREMRRVMVRAIGDAWRGRWGRRSIV